jgi:AraC-like DNA-binding protein
MGRTRFRLDSGMLRLLADLGIPTEEFLRQARLPRELVVADDPSLTVEDYFRFWETLDARLGSEEAPFLIGKSLRIGLFNAPILAALSSSHLVPAFERLSRFKPLLGPMSLDVTVGPGGTAVDLNVDVGDVPIPRLFWAAEAVFQVSVVRMATKAPVVPTLIESSVPWPLRPSREFFGCGITKSQRQRIVFSPEDSNRPFLTGNHDLAQFYEHDLQGELGRLSQEQSILSRVQTALVALLPSGVCGVDEVAAQLHMSARTLQRHLTAEKTTFQHQLSRAREGMAKHYLARSRLTGTEISYLLAYDDPNSFPRAFHQWTGQTPESYRRELRREASGE